MLDITKCTSENCCYKSSCYRQSDKEPPSENQEYYDYSWSCNFDSGWQDYIKEINNI